MNQNQESVRTEIIGLWKTVTRPGADRFLSFLTSSKSDFFSAPCSTEFHLAHAGGLALHSLNVYRLLKHKIEYFSRSNDHPILSESVIICGLGHDLCKINFYVPGTKNVKENGKWVEKSIWIVKDQLPLGHGEKSLSILQDFISLTEGEKLAIRWHMAAFDPSIHFPYPNGYAYKEACKRSPLVTLLFTADYEASNIIEG